MQSKVYQEHFFLLKNSNTYKFEEIISFYYKFFLFIYFISFFDILLKVGINYLVITN